MSKSTKPKFSKNSSEFTNELNTFMNITALPIKEATKYIQKYGKADTAIDAYYNDPNALASSASSASRAAPVSNSKLNAVFDEYRVPGETSSDEDIISIDGTIKFCADLGVDPEDVVLLAVAYELKAPGVGEFTRKGWREGWKRLSVDSVSGMKALLPSLREKLGKDFTYLRKVYLFTFDFARSEGQRSLALDTAQAFWGLLLPHAVAGGALAHVENDEEEDAQPDGQPGWNDDLTQLWFEFLEKKGGKGISKDTWNQFLSFARTIDPTLEKHDLEAAWPSTIDDFVEWAKERRANSV